MTNLEACVRNPGVPQEGLHTLSDHQGGGHYSLGPLLPIKLTKSGQQPKGLEHPQ